MDTQKGGQVHWQRAAQTHCGCQALARQSSKALPQQCVHMGAVLRDSRHGSAETRKDAQHLPHPTAGDVSETGSLY